MIHPHVSKRGITWKIFVPYYNIKWFLNQAIVSAIVTESGRGEKSDTGFLIF
jgi:hypothetical protein